MLVYALCFGLGVALCNLLGARMNLSLVPLVAGAAFAGIVATITLATSSSPHDVLEIDGTLAFPLGYRNANAAFFAIALFPALGLASARDADARLRVAAFATATLCINLCLSSQSRASAPAMLVALVVYLLASPVRIRALAWLALAALPAVVTFPAVASVFHASGGDTGVRAAVDEMHRLGLVIGATTAFSAVIGALAVRFERRLPGVGSGDPGSNRTVAIGLGAVAAIAAVTFLVSVGDPVNWLSNRADEFQHGGTPDLSNNTSRFTVNAGSNRYDAWRVALSDFGDDPLFGDGGGGYRYSYLRKRDSASQYLHDAHSVELELLSELGIVGLALFGTFVVASTMGVVRARRLGPSAAGLSAIALASGSYWLVHTSLDWFWPYPAVTAPLLALVGSACAPTIREIGRRSTRSWRHWALAGLAVLAISAVPPLLADRMVDNAYATWRTDLAAAYDDLDRAHTLNPFSDGPPLAEASIARASGDDPRALAALHQAADIRPDEWATHYLLADLQVTKDRALARNEILLALELNPLSDRVQVLAKQLGVDPGSFESQ